MTRPPKTAPAPAVNLAKRYARHQPLNTIRTITPNSTPKRHSQTTRPSISQICTRTVTSTSSQNTTCTSTPDCMPPSTLPSILQECARTVTCTPQNSTCTSTQTACPSTLPLIQINCARTITSSSNSTLNSTYTKAPNCMPPSTQPSISQITFPSLLEVRTPEAFSYLGNDKSLNMFAFKELCTNQGGSLLVGGYSD